ncbi:MAG: cytochrome ubiquinol oxidase subunit I [Candidatus Micrarchaeota archaeon]|nr:cytochrome ubiquinol oxidase subunit I [Candidatus Micrarchaeota archaeon]
MTIFDRSAMGISLAVHIILAVVGMTLPLMIMVYEYLGIRRRDKDYLTIARRLTTAFIVLFAIGAASGFVVAANIFFGWPKFMQLVGNVAVLTQFLEVFAFFGESIFLATYLYSYNKFRNRYGHVAVMGLVFLFATLSAVLITMLNAFMNTPAGFDINAYVSTGLITNVNPLAVFNAPSTWIEVPHVVFTSFYTGAFILVAFLAYKMLKRSMTGRERQVYRKALGPAVAVAIVFTVLSILTGMASISTLYYQQPEKYAAMELDMVPTAFAPEYIGGLYINGKIMYAIPIPGLQSMLATGSPSGTVPGLSQYPQSTWPPLIIHFMFDLMVGLSLLAGLALLLVLLLKLLKREIYPRIVLIGLLASGIISVFILEDGWVLAELGRQPWIVYNVLKVADAANTSPAVVPVLIGIIAFYIVIIPLTILVLKRIFDSRPLAKEIGG